ncbi:MAG TPA: hypothetical protein DEP85_05610 [Holosporales bacterium]|nr:hypothetical protein [Holosporales bacterium]
MLLLRSLIVGVIVGVISAIILGSGLILLLLMANNPAPGFGERGIKMLITFSVFMGFSSMSLRFSELKSGKPSHFRLAYALSTVVIFIGMIVLFYYKNNLGGTFVFAASVALAVPAVAWGLSQKVLKDMGPFIN